jgi:uncharacterized membrane protein YdbT with pleckstrin-like domain
MATTASGTNVRYESIPPWRAYIGSVIFSFIMVFVYGVGILLFLLLTYIRHSNRFIIRGAGQDAEIEKRTGIIARNTNSIRVRDVRNINIRQGAIERLLGVGKVEFSSAGGAGIEVTFGPISHPEKVKELVAYLQREK